MEVGYLIGNRSESSHVEGGNQLGVRGPDGVIGCGETLTDNREGRKKLKRAEQR